MEAAALSPQIAALARELARSGQYGNWASVRTRLIQLGFAEIDALASPEISEEVNDICAKCYRPPGVTD
jgi:hypothetical protein